MERSVKCPMCNKPFIPAPEHVYRQEHKRNGRLVCSWKCACKEIPKVKRKRGRHDAVQKS